MSQTDSINSDEFEDLKQVISNLAQENNMEVEFSRGKRQNDVLVMSLKTAKDTALSFYLKVSEKFPNRLVHIFRLKDPEKRGLTAAIIEPMNIAEDDPFSPERRRSFFANKKTKGDWEDFLGEEFE